MKKTTSIFKPVVLISMVLVSFACSKLDRFTQFNLDYNETITIPAVLGLNLPFNIFTPNIKTNTEEILELNDSRKNLVEEVRLNELILTIIDPADSDFSFLKSVEIYIKTDSIPEVLVAWKYEIDNSIGKTITLEVSGEDLTQYILEDEFSIRALTVTDEIPLSDHEIDMQAQFFVNARILGI